MTPSICNIYFSLWRAIKLYSGTVGIPEAALRAGDIIQLDNNELNGCVAAFAMVPLESQLNAAELSSAGPAARKAETLRQLDTAKTKKPIETVFLNRGQDDDGGLKQEATSYWQVYIFDNIQSGVPLVRIRLFLMLEVTDGRPGHPTSFLSRSQSTILFLLTCRIMQLWWRHTTKGVRISKHCLETLGYWKISFRSNCTYRLERFPTCTGHCTFGGLRYANIACVWRYGYIGLHRNWVFL